MGQLFALLSAAFMGIGNVCARKGMESGKIDRFSGLFITLVINNLLNIICLSIYLAMFGGEPINLPGFVYNVIAGFLNSFAGRWTLFCSMSYIGASRAGILKVATPFFAILGGVFLLKEVITIQSWLGIIIVILGVVFISIETKEKEEQLAIKQLVSKPVGVDSDTNKIKKMRDVLPGKGIVLGLLASFFFAGGNVCRKVGVTFIPNPLLSVTIGSVVALLCAVILQMVRGKGPELILAFKNLNLSYFFAGVFTSLALYSLFWSLELIPITIVSSIGASEALFTMLASMILMGKKEMLNWRVVVGALVVIVGVIILIAM